jgi:hypothetical protein
VIGDTGFRVVLVSSVAAGVVGLIVSILSEASLPFELQRYLARQSSGPLSGRDLIAVVIWMPAMIVTVVAAVGMFFFWRPSRLLGVIATLLALLALPFSTPTVVSGITSFFNEASSILWGIVLGLAYWSSIAGRFEKPAK